MCSPADDPSDYSAPRTCEGRVYRLGEDRRCAQSVGVRQWQDHTGQPHAACPRHRGGLLRRNPVTMPGRTTRTHGVLRLTTPWARGLFGPAEIASLEDDIPAGYAVGVSVNRNRSGTIVWVTTGARSGAEGPVLASWTAANLDGVEQVRQAIDWLIPYAGAIDAMHGWAR